MIYKICLILVGEKKTHLANQYFIKGNVQQSTFTSVNFKFHLSLH